MKNKLNFGIFNYILVVFTLAGCATLGTKTLHISDDIYLFEPLKLGYSQIASESILDKIKPNTSDYCYETIETYYANKSDKIEKHPLSNYEFIDNVNIAEVIEICKINKLDGYLCTQIKYKFITNNYMFIPIGRSEDTYVEMKLFDKNGVLKIHTKHNTAMGNSYMLPPKSDKTVKDGTLGALKRIEKELTKNKIKASH